jgi:Protein of unknown function (DUF2924)
MRNVSEAVREKLRAEMESLKTLSRDQLKTRWKDLYGIEVPLRFSRGLLMRSVAYRMLERVLGGLKPGVRRLLEKVAENASKRIPSKVSIPAKVLPGTILIRQWGGVRHEVTVLEDGLQTPSIALQGRAPHHRQPLVGSVVLWPQGSRKERGRWSALAIRFAVAPCTRANRPKKASSRTSTRSTRNVKPARRSSRVSKVRDGDWSRHITTTVVSAGEKIPQ